MDSEKDYLDMTEPLMVDTYLRVKLGDKWMHIGVPRERKNNTFRTYGDVYSYFTSKYNNFRFAIGTILVGEDENTWSGQNDYFYFDKKHTPFLSFKETILYTCPKRK